MQLKNIIHLVKEEVYRGAFVGLVFRHKHPGDSGRCLMYSAPAPDGSKGYSLDYPEGWTYGWCENPKMNEIENIIFLDDKHAATAWLNGGQS